MSAMSVLQCLYCRFDAIVGQVLPERVCFWFKGVCLNVARRLSPVNLGAAVGMPDLLPAWAYAALREAAVDEPKLLPDLVVPYMRRITLPAGHFAIAKGYGRLWRDLDQAAQHVFVLGDVDGGVSDELLNVIERLAAQPTNRVMVIWTAPSEMNLEGLPNQIRPINLAALTGLHNVVEQAIILGRALLEIKPATIYIASSRAGWTMIRTISGALNESSYLYAELPPIKSCRGENKFKVAEQSVAAGLSKSIHLVVNSQKNIEGWLVRYGLDATSIGVVSNYDLAATAVKNFVIQSGQSVVPKNQEGCQGK